MKSLETRIAKEKCVNSGALTAGQHYSTNTSFQIQANPTFWLTYIPDWVEGMKEGVWTGGRMGRRQLRTVSTQNKSPLFW